jgi:hypothetical protein
MMTSTSADFWDTAMDVTTYLEQMTQNRDLFDRRIATTTINDEERAAFAGGPLRFLVLTEDFCGDSAQFIPPVIRLAQELDNVEIRLLLRDKHRSLAAGYVRKDGYQAIPVIIVLDGDGEEIGYLVERPERVNDALAAETRRFARENPQFDGINRTYDKMPAETRAAVKANSETFRDSQQAQWTRWLFDELSGIIARPDTIQQLAVAD